MMKKVVVLASMATVAAVLVAGVAGFGANNTPAVYASRLAGIQGAGGSGIQIQNLDASQDAQIVADFYNQKGSAAVTINRPNVAAGSAANIYLPTETSLTNGAYAAIISADRQIAAIARTDWSTSGGAAIYSNVIPGNEISVPLAAKGYSGQTTLASIQNTDTGQQATVTVEFFKAGSATALVSTQKNIGPGTSVTVDLGKDAAFSSVPAGTLGALVVKSANIPVGVQAFMDIENITKAVYAYEGVPAEQAAATLYAPLFRNDFYGTSGISVVNPGTSPVQVTVTYVASAGIPGLGCTGQTVHGGKAFTIDAKSSAVFYQGNIAALPTGASGLAPKCVGAAKIEATGGNILAIVNDADLGKTANSPGAGTSAAYNAFSAAAGAKKVALPLFRNKHTNLDLSTGIQAMNIGDAPANVSIEFKNSSGQLISVTGTSQTVAPLASGNWFPPLIAGMPTNVYGSASITSDQPVVVIVNDASGNGKVDAAIYSGIKAD
ncbi:MAG: hypothetical protein ACH37Z_05825 [Anaerolineae bacterium]